MKKLQLLALIASLAAPIMDLAKAFEASMPDSPGKDKLAAVLAAVRVLIEGIDDLGATWAEIEPRVTQVITVIVAAFNAAGVFRKRTKPA